MEHISSHLQNIGQPYGKGAYPRTDSIVSRSTRLSDGVVCVGMCSGIEININSSEDEIKKVAENIRGTCIVAGTSHTG